jgi:two-component system LytT family sensor kinase
MHDQIFIDTVGHCAGLVLFGLLVGLLWRNKPPENTRQGKLSLAAAVLVFVWNGAELLLLVQPRLPHTVLQAAADTSLLCLNFLPAILLHVALDGRLRPVAVTGYGLSAVSLLLQYSWGGGTDSLERPQSSLLLLSLGFALLSSCAWLWFEYDTRRKPDVPRPSRIAFLSLFVFATSFIHFRPGHTSNIWMGEAIWHHAAIPIALVVLLSDYRFLLLDTFLRFTVSAAWIALWVWVAADLGTKLRVPETGGSSPFVRGLALTVLCILVYALARSLGPLQALLTRVAFRRPPLNRLLHALQHLEPEPESDLLQAAAREIGIHYDCSRSTALADDPSPGYVAPVLINFHRGGESNLPDWTVAIIPLRFSKGDSYRICLGPRRGSRRFLSEDLSGLQRVQSTLIESVERLRREELERLAREAELEALQAQINPHFLFNALNTLYGTISRDSPEARELVLNLADVFRYRLHGKRKHVTISEEIEIVRAYLEIEALRLGNRLITEIEVDERLKATLIPILTVQPLVENAVKHGASASGKIFVRLTIAASDGGARISVEDKGPGFQTYRQSSGAGIGLTNVHQRLHLCYGAQCGLEFESNSDGSKVWFTVPALLPVIVRT